MRGKEKHEVFLKEWAKCYIEKYGYDSDPDSDEHKDDEISDNIIWTIEIIIKLVLL